MEMERDDVTCLNLIVSYYGKFNYKLFHNVSIFIMVRMDWMLIMNCMDWMIYNSNNIQSIQVIINIEIV